MYEKLIKALRLCVKYNKATDALMNASQAADAIEELSKPRWIPVAERLPKDEKDVLAYYGFKHDGVLSDQRFIGTLCYFRFDPNPHWQYEGQGKLTVTHWMPLPEPPKEGDMNA